MTHLDSIRVHRVRARMTQSDVANALGVRPATISNWETGAAMPNGRDLQRLARVLGCSTDDIDLSVQAVA